MEKVQTDDRLKELTETLEAGVASVFTNERYVEYLKVMSRFHNYSFRNILLIFLQKPNASLVAGYHAWLNKFERHVMRGEKGIKIIVPKPFKMKVEEELLDPNTKLPIFDALGNPKTILVEHIIPRFGVGTVFDVSQTEGKELPNIGADALTGTVENYNDLFQSLQSIAPCPVEFEDIPDADCFGYYHLIENRIAIKSGISQMQTIKTAIHEIAHAKLHAVSPDEVQSIAPAERKNRREREVEAESIAYVVSSYFGFDTSSYSFGYVASWSSGKELSELKSSLELISSTAGDMIAAIDAKFNELSLGRSEPITVKQEPSYSIYQLKPSDTTRYLRFEPFDSVHAAGMRIDKANYNLVYTAPLSQNETLDDIYERFNINHPADFRGHSLSVSDVVAIQRDGKSDYFYVDSVGFRKLPSFAEVQDKSLKAPAKKKFSHDYEISL